VARFQGPIEERNSVAESLDFAALLILIHDERAKGGTWHRQEICSLMRRTPTLTPALALRHM